MPLFDAILEENNFTEDKAKKMVEKLFGAINYLHHHSIAHRDLKPGLENIFWIFFYFFFNFFFFFLIFYLFIFLSHVIVILFIK